MKPKIISIMIMFNTLASFSQRTITNKDISKDFHNDYNLDRHSPKKINHKDLEFRNGLFYIKSTGKLFTGKAHGYYPNGEAEIISNIKEGKQHGKRKLFWDSGKKFGIVFEDENFNNYKRVKFWSEDGTVSFQGKYINGKLYEKGSKIPFTGKTRSYYENGQISGESEFKEGLWHGTQILYTRDGKIKSKCYFENNKIVDCPIYQKKTNK